MKTTHKPSPVIILVAPQMGENIGAAARVMSNFGYSELRIVSPRDGWPNPKAVEMSAHGRHILDNAKIFSSVEAAISDLNYLIATSAQKRYMNKQVVESYNISSLDALSGTCGVLFGCERSGLRNEELQMADAIVTIPVSETNPSLNLAQAVAVICYELSRTTAATPYGKSQQPALKEELGYFFQDLENKLIDTGFLRHETIMVTMRKNIRNMFIRAKLTSQDLRTLHGIINSLYNKNHKN